MTIAMSMTVSVSMTMTILCYTVVCYAMLRYTELCYAMLYYCTELKTKITGIFAFMMLLALG